MTRAEVKNQELKMMHNQFRTRLILTGVSALATMAYVSIWTVFMIFGRVDHFPYFLTLAPFDFNSYPKVKSHLKGRRFSSLPELRSASANIISQYNQDWSRAIFNKWVKRHRKCIAYNGEYLEKK